MCLLPLILNLSRCPKEIQPKGEDNCSLFITNNLPSPIINSLQKNAQSFTLATGNYPLSEAIENGQFPIYETLNFNAGVQSALIWQVENATKKLELSSNLVEAVKILIKASPENLSKFTEQIKVVIAHPKEIK
jgi:hypothetical protein